MVLAACPFSILAVNKIILHVFINSSTKTLLILLYSAHGHSHGGGSHGHSHGGSKKNGHGHSHAKGGIPHEHEEKPLKGK